MASGPFCAHFSPGLALEKDFLVDAQDPLGLAGPDGLGAHGDGLHHRHVGLLLRLCPEVVQVELDVGADPRLRMETRLEELGPPPRGHLIAAEAASVVVSNVRKVDVDVVALAARPGGGGSGTFGSGLGLVVPLGLLPRGPRVVAAQGRGLRRPAPPGGVRLPDVLVAPGHNGARRGVERVLVTALQDGLQVCRGAPGPAVLDSGGRRCGCSGAPIPVAGPGGQ